MFKNKIANVIVGLVLLAFSLMAVNKYYEQPTEVPHTDTNVEQQGVFEMTYDSKEYVPSENNKNEYLYVVVFYESKDWIGSRTYWYCEVPKVSYYLLDGWDRETFVWEDGRPSRDNFECFENENQIAHHITQEH